MDVSNSNNVTSSPRPSQLSSSAVDAHDQVRVKGTTYDRDLTDGVSPFDLLGTMTLAQGPTLLELATLLTVISDH